MSSFDYMNFNDGYADCEFVVHANKFTKEQAIELCLVENDFRFKEEHHKPYKLLRKPIVDDVIMRYIRYYPKTPEWCGCDNESGCYTYCNKDSRGCFPVWVMKFEPLEVNTDE